jgi:hypothetical protein
VNSYTRLRDILAAEPDPSLRGAFIAGYMACVGHVFTDNEEALITAGVAATRSHYV